MARKPPLDGPEQKVQNALDAVREARTAIREDDEWARAVKLATTFWEDLDREAKAAASDRAYVVERHHRVNRVKIADLAKVMEVDPPRVSQLNARAKKEAKDG
jgi:hypothetical protein